MITAELRGGNKPSLNEALSWIGSKVDDIYGSSVGRLEDVWIDPGTGAPKWLLVKEGRFGGRTTLIPFEDATAGAGHVWVPYEKDVVREAPPVSPGSPLTQSVEKALRSHYEANKPTTPTHRGRGEAPAHAPAPAAAPAHAYAADAHGPPPEQQVHQYQRMQEPHANHDPHQPLPPLPPAPHGRPAARREPQRQRPQYASPPPARPPARPAPPQRHGAPPARSGYPAPPPQPAQRPPTYAPPPAAPQPASYDRPGANYAPAPYPPAPPPPQPSPAAPPPAPAPVAPAPPASPHAGDDPDRPVAIPIVHALDQPYRVEVQLEGELRISGELKGFSIKPTGQQPPEPDGPEHSQ